MEQTPWISVCCFLLHVCFSNFSLHLLNTYYVPGNSDLRIFLLILKRTVLGKIKTQFQNKNPLTSTKAIFFILRLLDWVMSEKTVSFISKCTSNRLFPQSQCIIKLGCSCRNTSHFHSTIHFSHEALTGLSSCANGVKPQGRKRHKSQVLSTGGLRPEWTHIPKHST